MDKTKKKLISIVSPAYNEAENIPLMVKEVRKVMEKLSVNYDYEYILVDDGSVDNTWEVIIEEAKKCTRVKGLSLSRNFSHQISLTAGLDFAKGDAVIYCDSDLQHPPSIFPKLVDLWEKGYLVVHTVRSETEGEPFFKKKLSDFFYFFINILSNIKIEKGMADFKLLDRKVLNKLNSMREHNRFLRGMIPWIGFKSTTVEYKAQRRIHGKPWYNFRRNLAFAKTGILAFSIKPLKYIGYVGLFLTLISSIMLIVDLVLFVTYRGWYFSPAVTLLLGVSLLLGIVLISLGIIALYISYIYYEVINRPLYLIADVVNENY